jgi:hypothetical protein
MDHKEIDEAFIVYGRALVSLRESINKAFILIFFMYMALLVLMLTMALSS